MHAAIITLVIVYSGISLFMQKPRNPPCGQPDSVDCFKHGGHCLICAAFDEDFFEANWHPAVFVFQSVLLKYIKNLYQAFDRDLVLALVMCEIWQFNLERYFDRYGQEDTTCTLNTADRRKLLPPCNAYSISSSLGVPSETVRRKIKKLVSLGYVENGNGEMVATKACEELFGSEMRIQIMREYVSSARHVLALLEKSPDGVDQSK